MRKSVPGAPAGKKPTPKKPPGPIRPVPATSVTVRPHTPARPVRQQPVPETSEPPEVFDPQQQDHILISYAWEDMAAADWLARKLMAEGYKVWRDGLKLFGGERFESVIDNAIKTKSFCVLGLLSKHSIKKENPSKERSLAMDLGKFWGIQDFLIPLNLDGLSSRQISWSHYGIQYIPFENWADGFQKLLKRLGESGAPKPLSTGEGRALAAETFLPRGILVPKTETLYTNCLRLEHIPEKLHVFELTEALTAAEAESVSLPWGHATPSRTIAWSPSGLQRRPFLRQRTKPSGMPCPGGSRRRWKESRRETSFRTCYGNRSAELLSGVDFNTIQRLTWSTSLRVCCPLTRSGMRTGVASVCLSAS